MKGKQYHYLECGLPNVYLANGFTCVDTPYGGGVSITDVDGLHRCIAEALCEKPGLLTGAEFRFLRIELNFSQTMLAQILGCDARNIRRIESAEKVKDLYNRLIRLIYLESIDPASTCVGLFEHLREIDVEWHDRLNLATDRKNGWALTA